LQRAANDSLPTNALKTRLIIVGHSLGADAVYNAISQIVTERFVDTIKRKPGALLKPLGDQVILLNPAFEASRMYDLEQLARSVTDYAPNQRPVLTVLQSKGDWATRTFFPLGQKIGAVIQRYRSGFQRQANYKSAGWFEPFITHQLLFDANAPNLTGTGTRPPQNGKHELRSSDKLPGAAENIMSQRSVWRASSGVATTNVFGNCVMTSGPRYKARDPIVVVSVAKEIMKDHDDIGNPVLINFLQEYIPFCDDDPRT
jgi:hypothetical protein